jgi:hypothetical protein
MDDSYTPESLAWKLLLDEEVGNGDMLAYSDPNENKYVIKFEIFLTIYLEMIINHYKMLYIENNVDEDITDDDVENNFKLNFDNINLELLLNPFKEKLQKIKCQLNIHELNKDHYDYIKTSRYCTILFRDLPKDETYFIMNERYIEKDKRYHFVLYGPTNEKKSSFNNLKDIYACININDKYFKISFDSI